jgi:hypothetical protein
MLMLILNDVSVIDPGVIPHIVLASDETSLSYYVVRYIVWQLLDNTFRPNNVGYVIKQEINKLRGYVKRNRTFLEGGIHYNMKYS